MLGHTSAPAEQRGLLRELCAVCDADALLGDASALRLSQAVVLSLTQQLGATLAEGGADWKLRWLRAAALALKPSDKVIAPHVGAILGALLRTLDRAQEQSAEHRSDIKVIMHIINSIILTAQK